LLNHATNHTQTRWQQVKTENKMKKKINFFIVSYLVFLCLSIISCEDECGSSPNKFKIKSLKWQTFQIENTEEKYNIKFYEIEDKSVSYKKFSIKINAEIDTYYSNNIFSPKNIFIRSAYACDPALPTSDETITKIEIFANNDYNKHYKSGKDISNLFDILVVSNTNEFYYDKFDLNEFINSKPNVANELVLILKEAPENTSNFKFEIKYYQDGIDLNNYNFETNEIEISKN
jgi:hypothetical protein